MGVFSAVGTPRRWLWPALWILALDGILFPVWQRDVRFTVTNSPDVAPDGGSIVRAERAFHLAGRDRVMIDAVSIVNGSLVDRLGRRGRLESTLRLNVNDGRLMLESVRTRLRLGAKGLTIPAAISPRVSLSEQIDPITGMQSVTVTVDAPIIGRIYEYSGSFTYSIRKVRS